jgi:GNAT superfamily N-acetyltransferase
MEIKPASKEELFLVQDLAYQIWPAYYETIISMEQIEFMLRNFYSIEALGEQAEKGHQFFLVWDYKKAIGFLSLSDQARQEMKIEKLYLLPEIRGKGMGKACIDFAKTELRRKKYKTLILNVNRFNNSRDFYFHQGFRIRESLDIPLHGFWLNDFILEWNPN